MDEADNYALKGGPENLSAEDEEQYYVRWRCYQSEEELTGPDQSFATLPELTYEILKRFSSYYSIYSRLMSDFTNFYFRVAFYSKNDAIYEIHTNAPEMTIDDMMAMGKYIYYSGDSNDLAVRTNFNSTFPSVPALMAKANPYNSSNNYVVIGLDTTYKALDDLCPCVYPVQQLQEDLRKRTLPGLHRPGRLPSDLCFPYVCLGPSGSWGPGPWSFIPLIRSKRI